MTIHASKLSTSKKKYNKEVFCIMFAAKSVPAYRIVSLKDKRSKTVFTKL